MVTHPPGHGQRRAIFFHGLIAIQLREKVYPSYSQLVVYWCFMTLLQNISRLLSFLITALLLTALVTGYQGSLLIELMLPGGGARVHLDSRSKFHDNELYRPDATDLDSSENENL